MASKIVLNNTCIDIYDYEPGDCEELEKSLSVWNQVYFRMEPRALFYDQENKLLKVPRGIDVGYLESKLKCPVHTNTNYNEYEKTKFRLRVEPRDDIQRKAISFLVGANNFSYTKNYSQVSLNLDTGDGKTYCVIASLSMIKLKPIIITHTDTIKEQWMNSFNKMTSIDPRRMCNLSGSKQLEDILLNQTSEQYDVYFVNHGTIKAYAKKHGWENLNSLFQGLGVGVKVFDEAHLEFKSILQVDAYTNVYKTFYITATFERTDRSEAAVFKLAFKNIPKYGIETRGEKRKHIKYIAIKFNSRPNMEDKASIRGPQGFNRHAYMDYQISKGVIFDVIKYVMDTFQRIEGHALILSSKIESSEIIADKIREWYPEKEVLVYHSKTPKKDKENVRSMDVVSSTPQSASTGFDFPGLRYNIMCEPYNAKITANQVAGRLREIPDEYTYHIELIDVGFEKVKRMYKDRLSVFKEKCYSVSEMDY